MNREISTELAAFQRSLKAGPEAALSPEAQYRADKEHFYLVAREIELGDSSEFQLLIELGKAHLKSRAC